MQPQEWFHYVYKICQQILSTYSVPDTVLWTYMHYII